MTHLVGSGAGNNTELVLFGNDELSLSQTRQIRSRVSDASSDGRAESTFSAFDIRCRGLVRSEVDPVHSRTTV